MNQLLVFLGIIAFSFNSASQDFEEDLNSLSSTLEQSKCIAIDTRIRVYNTRGGTQIYSSEASVRKDSICHWTKLDDQEFLNSKDYSVTIDHTEKRVLVVKRNQFTVPDLSKMEVKEIMNFLKSNGGGELKNGITSNLVKSKESIRTYKLTGVNGFDEVLFSLDTTANTIRSIEYIVENGGNHIVLEYTLFSYKDVRYSELQIVNVFTVSEGKIQLSDLYKNYKLFTEL